MFLAVGLKQPFCKAIHSYQSTAKLRMCETLLQVSFYGIVSRFCDSLRNHCQYVCCIKSSLLLFIQGVPGGMCNTSGGCSLGQTIPI